MAGLVGIVTESPGARLAPSELDRFAACYESLRSEPVRARLSADQLGDVVLFGTSSDPSAGLTRQGESWAAYVGGPVLQQNSPLFADASAFDGQFALVRYAGQPKRLEIMSDPFGLQALYLASRDGLTYVSTSLLALAKHLRARPNIQGLEVFLRTGSNFTGLTSWEGIARVAPASLRSFDPARSSESVYWRPQVDVRVAGMTLEAATSVCVATARDALAARYSRAKPAWCDITGGFDTRLLALLLQKAGVEFTTNTVGTDDSPDVVLGRRVAGVAGWPWVHGETVDLHRNGWQDSIRNAVAWGDGQMEAVQLAGVIAGHKQRSMTANTLFAGGGGGVWRDYAWQQEGPLGGRTRRVNLGRWVATRFLTSMELSPFSSDPTLDARETLIERCRAYAEPYAAELNSAQLDMLLAYKSIGHDGAYQSAARGAVCVELPFFAKPVFETPFSVAPKLRNFHRLMRHAIALLDHPVAAVATTSGGPAEPLCPSNLVRFVPYAVHRGRGLARKLTQNSRGPTIGKLREASERSELELRGRVLEHFIASTGLDPARMRSGPLYNAEGLRRLAESDTATASGWKTLGRIITAERALELVDASID